MVGLSRESSLKAEEEEEETQLLDSLNDDPMLRLHYGLHITFQVGVARQTICGGSSPLVGGFRLFATRRVRVFMAVAQGSRVHPSDSRVEDQGRNVPLSVRFLAPQLQLQRSPL